jgi:hypothetical protein
MPLILAGATSGQATVQATDAATVTLTLPATSGTLVTTGGAQTIEFADGSAAAPSITNSGDTNTGMFFPAADTIAFTEGGTESMRIDSSGNLLFNSGYGSVATAYGCRAWVNFNGTGTVAIRASGNVSSVGDNGVGNYSINFTNSMPDVNYSTVVSTQHQDGVTKQVGASGANFSSSAGTVQIFTFAGAAGADFDSGTVNLAVFR